MNDKNYTLDTPVRYFKGVGPKRGEYLANTGINTVEDALYYLPARYEDRSNFTAIKDLKIGQKQTVRGEVVATGSRLTRSGMALFEMAIADKTGYLHGVWFNQPYLKDYFRKGQKIVLYGKVERRDKLEMIQPEYELLEEGEKDSVNMGRIVPVYPATSQLTQRYLRALIHMTVEKCARLLKETLPTRMLAAERMVDLRFAIRNIHFPAAFANLEKAYKRIVFEEFFMLQLALALRKKDAKSEGAGFGHKLSAELLGSFKAALPFKMTEGQERAISEITRDMASTKPMNRLLEGDVGSGKTVVAAYALLATAENGLQGVLMAPTEVLARQHFIVLSEILMPLGVSVTLLVGGIELKTRKKLYEEISNGNIDIVVGTHAIIQEAVKFKKLGLAVIDEQHKFGVTQRAVLKEKGYSPHILVMTATPIPRTLALTVYGDLDISVMRQSPKGRKPISTYWVEEEKRQSVYNFIREELEKGRQAYVVCPLIDSSPNTEHRKPQSATGMFDKLKNEEFAGYEVGLLHGKMSSKEKEKVMRDFKKGKIDLLVSTVVIEVGIDVANATVMLVENAERFGLAQLHQLRGRIGRGEHESYCILLADPKTEAAAQRLKAVESTLDGFQIAEADLDIRGPGEFFGTRQHGLPEIRFGNILKDFGIMELARREAFALVAADPNLDEENHRLLKRKLAERFAGKMSLIDVR